MEHLIADSGIHFISKEIEFNPSEPLLVSGGKTLKYSFCETIDFLEGYRIFNILYFDQDSGKYIPVDEMQNSDGCVIRRPNGREELDVTGMVQKEPMCSTTLLTTYDEGNEDVFSINSMLSFRVKDPKNTVLYGHSILKRQRMNCLFCALISQRMKMALQNMACAIRLTCC